MTIAVRHNFTCLVPDSATPGLIKTSHWNDTHSLSMDTGKLLGRTTAGEGQAEEITVSGGLALAAGTLYIADSGVAAGSYLNPAITVDAKGRITFIENGSSVGLLGPLMAKSVYDPNDIEGDTFDMDNMVEGSDTKILTAAERAKLAGIEALADVTDAGNVGSSIHGATGKTTPVDADTLPLIDSAASNVLKKVTWANIKATLKTYFDTLYQPLASGLTSWASVTRASGFDTFVATPSSANLRALMTDEAGTGALMFGVTTTRGDIIRRGASSDERVALGTSGYALISDGTDPVWTGFLQAGASATTRTWQAKGRDIVSVTDFGAVGDYNGTTGTDNSAAFNAALAAHSAVYVPPGVYYCASALAASNRPILLYGSGQEATIIVFADSVVIGLTVTQNSGQYPVSMQDLTFATRADPENVSERRTAVVITWPVGWDNRFHNKGIIRNVEFRGYDTENEGWYDHVNIANGNSYHFHYCNFFGKNGDGPTSQTEASVTHSRYGVSWAGGWYPTDVEFIGCNFYCMQTAVLPAGAAEGIILDDCTVVFCNYGVYWQTGNFDAGLGGGSAAGRPHLSITSTHMNVFLGCVFTAGVVQIIIANNAFYHSNLAVSTGTLINLTHGSDARIHDNIYRKYSDGAYACNGVTIGDASLNFVNANIHDEDFGDDFSTCIWFRSDASNCRQRANTFGTVAVAQVFDEGSNNVWGVHPLDMPTGSIVTSKSDTYTGTGALANIIAIDGSKPQNTEGTEILSISHALSQAGNKVRGRVTGYGSTSSGSALIMALFVDSGADAIQATVEQNATNTHRRHMTMEFEYSPGDVASHDYKIRVGTNAGDAYMNGAGGNDFGSLSVTMFVLEEIKG